MEAKEIHGVPVEIWYSLMVAADVDRAWNRTPGRLCQLLEDVFGEVDDTSSSHV